MAALENEDREAYGRSVGVGGVGRWRLDKKALENRIQNIDDLSCHYSVSGTLKDIYLYPHNDPAMENYGSHFTVRFRPK